MAGAGAWGHHAPGQRHADDARRLAARAGLILLKRKRDELLRQRMRAEAGLPRAVTPPPDASPPLGPALGSVGAGILPPQGRFAGVPDFSRFVAVRSIAALTGDDQTAARRAKPSPLNKVLDAAFPVDAHIAEDGRPDAVEGTVPPSAEECGTASEADALMQSDTDRHAELLAKLRVLLHGTGAEGGGWAASAAEELQRRRGDMRREAGRMGDGNMHRVAQPARGLRRVHRKWGLAVAPSPEAPSPSSFFAEIDDVSPVPQAPMGLPAEFLSAYLPNYAWNDVREEVRQGPVARSGCSYDEGATAPNGVGRCNTAHCTYLHPQGHTVAEYAMVVRLLEAVTVCGGADLPGFDELVERCAAQRGECRGQLVNTLDFRDLLTDVVRWLRRWGMVEILVAEHEHTQRAQRPRARIVPQRGAKVAVPDVHAGAEVWGRTASASASASVSSDDVFEVTEVINVDDNRIDSLASRESTPPSAPQRDGSNLVPGGCADATTKAIAHCPEGDPSEDNVDEAARPLVADLVTDAVNRLKARTPGPTNAVARRRVDRIAAALVLAESEAPSGHAFACEVRRFLENEEERAAGTDAAREPFELHPLPMMIFALGDHPVVTSVAVLRSAVNGFVQSCTELWTPDAAPRPLSSSTDNRRELIGTLTSEFVYWIASNGRIRDGGGDPVGLLRYGRFLGALVGSAALAAPGVAVRGAVSELERMVEEARVGGTSSALAAEPLRRNFEAWVRLAAQPPVGLPCELVAGAAVLDGKWYDPDDACDFEADDALAAGSPPNVLAPQVLLHPHAEAYAFAYLAAKLKTQPLSPGCLALEGGYVSTALDALYRGGGASVAVLPDYEAALRRYPTSTRLPYLYIEALVRGDGDVRAEGGSPSERTYAGVCRAAGIGMDRALINARHPTNAHSPAAPSEELFAMILLNVFLRGACAHPADTQRAFLQNLLVPAKAPEHLACVLLERHLAALPMVFAAVVQGVFPARLGHVWALVPGMPLSLPACHSASSPTPVDASVVDVFEAFLDRRWSSARVRDALVVGYTEYLVASGDAAAACDAARRSLRGDPHRPALWVRLAQLVGPAERGGVYVEALRTCGVRRSGGTEQSDQGAGAAEVVAGGGGVEQAPVAGGARGLLEDMARRGPVASGLKRKADAMDDVTTPPRAPPAKKVCTRAEPAVKPMGSQRNARATSQLCVFYFQHLVRVGCRGDAVAFAERQQQQAWLVEPYATYLRACRELLGRRRRAFLDGLTDLARHVGDPDDEAHIQREIWGYRPPSDAGLQDIIDAARADHEGSPRSCWPYTGPLRGTWRDWAIFHDVVGVLGGTPAGIQRAAEACGTSLRPAAVCKGAADAAALQFIDCAFYVADPDDGGGGAAADGMP